MKYKTITHHYMKTELKKLIKSLNNVGGFMEQTGYMTADRWNQINDIKNLFITVIKEMSVDEKLKKEKYNF